MIFYRELQNSKLNNSDKFHGHIFKNKRERAEKQPKKRDFLQNGRQKSPSQQAKLQFLKILKSIFVFSGKFPTR